MKKVIKGIKSLSIPQELKEQLIPLCNNYQGYVDRRQGPTWRSIVVAMCNVYGKTARDQVAYVITNDGATPGTVEKKVVRTPMKQVTRPTSAVTKTGDCIGCQDKKEKKIAAQVAAREAEKQPATQESKQVAPPAAEQTVKAPPAEQEEEAVVSLLDARQYKDVQQYFYGGIGFEKGFETMKKFARANNIGLAPNKLKDDVYVAKKIYSYVQAQQKAKEVRAKVRQNNEPGKKK